MSMKSSLPKRLPKCELPRERLKEKGAWALFNRELIALLLGSGSSSCDIFVIADQLLLQFGSLLAIARASLDQLSKIPGIGPSKSVD